MKKKMTLFAILICAIICVAQETKEPHKLLQQINKSDVNKCSEPNLLNVLPPIQTKLNPKIETISPYIEFQELEYSISRLRRKAKNLDSKIKDLELKLLDLESIIYDLDSTINGIHGLKSRVRLLEWGNK